MSQEEKILVVKIGERLKKLRIEKGFSNQESFAYVSDIPRAQYGRYEKGTNLTIVSLFKILKAHHLTFSEFFAEGFGEVEEMMRSRAGDNFV